MQVSEMIERVARASFDCWKKTQPGKENLPFEALRNIEHEDDFAFAHARAIIQAMREPTEAMDEAGDMPPGSSSRVWRSMIDEALK